MNRVLLILITLNHSFAFLQRNVESIVFEINPKFGNITKDSDNATHTGLIDLWIYENISNFTVQLVLHKDTGELFSNFTIKPCVNKVKHKMNFESEKALGFSDNAMQTFEKLPGRKCPIEQGHYSISAKENHSRLPFTVSSLNGTPGNFTKNAKLFGFGNGNECENIMTVIERYQIIEVEE